MRRPVKHHADAGIGISIDAVNPPLEKSGEREWPWKAVLSCDRDSLFGCASAGIAISVLKIVRQFDRKQH
jgi:hypothetical protein